MDSSHHAVQDSEPETPVNEVFSLVGILDTSAASAAAAAANRLYATSRSGLRFFSDYRRVVPTDRLKAEDLVDEESAEEEVALFV